MFIINAFSAVVYATLIMFILHIRKRIKYLRAERIKLSEQLILDKFEELLNSLARVAETSGDAWPLESVMRDLSTLGALACKSGPQIYRSFKSIVKVDGDSHTVTFILTFNDTTRELVYPDSLYAIPGVRKEPK